MTANKSANIIFLHIPKAAGCTLGEVLARQYRDHKTFDIDVQDYCGSVEQLKREAAKETRPLLVRGHQFYGLHEFLNGPTKYITMLRDPVQRMLSMYFYILKTPVHYLYDEVFSGKISLLEFVASELTRELDNAQVRLISGTGPELGFGKVTGSHLEKAKKNIETMFCSAGLQEFFDESLLLMAANLGWKRLPLYYSRNVTSGHGEDRSANEDVLRMIVKKNQYDIQLYEWVHQRLLAELNERQSIDVELTKFRRTKEAYVRRMHGIYAMKQFAKRFLPGRSLPVDNGNNAADRGFM